jgi:competence protein ComEC
MRKFFFFTFISVVLILSIFVYQSIYFNDNRLHVVFCNVGQGDAIFIKTPDNAHILVDGGPDKSVISCFAEHMSFWEKILQVMILTHPHTDHFSGLVDVIDRYITLSFVT